MPETPDTDSGFQSPISEALRQTALLVGQLSASPDLIHDIRSQLNGAIGNTSLITPLDPASAEALARLSTSAVEAESSPRGCLLTGGSLTGSWPTRTPGSRYVANRSTPPSSGRSSPTSGPPDRLDR